jgi:hypothetical protein
MRWRIATTLGLASTALVVGTAQGSASQAATWYSSLPMSSSLSTPAQVSGTLADADDHVLQAWPLVLIVQPADDQMAVGTPATMTPVSRGYTDDFGRFSLTVPDPGALVPEAAPGGLVDFVVYAPGSTARPYYFSRRLTLNPDGYALISPSSPPSTVNTGAMSAQTAATGSAATSEFDPPEDALMGGRQGSLAGMTGDAYDTADFTSAPDAPIGPPNADAGVGTCTKTKEKELTNRVGIVGQWYSTLGAASSWKSTDKGSAVWSDFHYGQGAGSAISVAVSESGRYGTFSMSGTKSKDSAGTVGFGHDYNDGGWLHQTYFDSARYRNTCPETTWYSVEPDGWRGGDDPDSRIAAPIPSNTNDNDYCVKYGADSEWKQDFSSAVTWTNGYDLLGPIGINVSIHTGYNKNASLYVKFNAQGRLCGRGSLPRNHPRVLVARKYL